VATRRRRKIIRNLAFSLIMLVFVFGGIEGCLTAVGWPERDPEARFAHKDVYWIEDGDQDKVAVAHRETSGSFEVTTDENGLRFPIHPATKPSDVTRIMTMGCSTTYGWGVDDDESYPARLEALLRQEGYRSTEVINAGQPGYTSFQGRWLWETVAHKYKPDIVLLGFVVQDARRAQYSDLSQALQQGNAEFLKYNVLYKWRLYLALKSLRDKDLIRSKERDEEGTKGVFRVSHQQYLDNLRALRSEIEASGGQVVHFGYPLEREGYTRQHRIVLRIEAEREGLSHFDPSSTIERLTQHSELYFPSDKGHANAAGNDEIARLVLKFLEGSGLLPPKGK
jgi:lysophospholipase L1-like esterase